MLRLLSLTMLIRVYAEMLATFSVALVDAQVGRSSSYELNKKLNRTEL